MKKLLAAVLCFGLFVLPALAQKNLFRNVEFKGKSSWSFLGKVVPDGQGGAKVSLSRTRKGFMDGGIGQRYNAPAKGYYKVSVSYQGQKFHTIMFWIQIRMGSGRKPLYRTNAVPVKSSASFQKAEFTFDIPAGARGVYVQITGRAGHTVKDASVVLKDVSLISVPKPAGAVDGGEKVSPLGKEVNVKKYFDQTLKAISQGHPRLFYNDKLFAEMKRKAKTPELSPYIATVRRNVLLQYPKLLKYYKEDDGLGPNEPLSRRYHPLENWGRVAANAAILYRLTGEKQFADIGIDLMKKLTPWYNKRFKVNRAVSWYGWGRINTVLAWDWLYDVMTREDRDAIAREMIAHCKLLANRSFIAKLCPLGEGLNGPGSGFYSAQCMLPWYAGIVFYNKGYDDKFIRKDLLRGLRGHLQMLANRNGMAGDDGGSVNATPGYCYGTYNNVEFLFFISYQALTGKNIAEDFPGMGLFPFWLSYTIFKGIDGRNYDFGTGSAWNIHNVFEPPSIYHSMYRNFYDGPLADISDEIHKSRRWGSWTPYNFLLNFNTLFLFYKNCDLENVKDNSATYAKMPKGYFFENLGQFYMHSGRKPTDTRVTFICGAKSPSHKECDENHFVIYKGGFLAQDTGTRTVDFSKKGRDLYYAHNSNYKAQSIAHNVVLIRMEGERFSAWRFDPSKLSNHAGMNKTIGGVVRAYETNNDFTYIAGDSSACYNPLKARQVVRQFLMIYPDVILIYDTVKSVKADQTKTWLLHTQEEPLIQGNMFSAVQREGRIFCRTLLPAKASLVKVGGPGNEFSVEGRNYPLGPHLAKNIASARKLGYDAPLWGAWRMEVRDPGAKKDNTFFHMIQVGLKKDFKKMIDVKRLSKGTLDGASFRYNGVDYTISFDRVKVPSGHIKAVKNGKVLYNRPFTNKVQAQRAMDYLK